tara:strand:- start:48193 stop:48465 length:273 start_codon:yes stop_codon:yes gene_type:complete
MRHPVNLRDYHGTLTELAREIADFRYDALAEFIGYLADDLTRQAESDGKRGRPQLSRTVDNLTEDLYNAQKKMEKAWRLSKPHMKPEDLL